MRISFKRVRFKMLKRGHYKSACENFNRRVGLRDRRTDVM